MLESSIIFRNFALVVGNVLETRLKTLSLAVGLLDCWKRILYVSDFVNV